MFGNTNVENIVIKNFHDPIGRKISNSLYYWRLIKIEKYEEVTTYSPLIFALLTRTLIHKKG